MTCFFWCLLCASTADLFNTEVTSEHPPLATSPHPVGPSASTAMTSTGQTRSKVLYLWQQQVRTGSWKIFHLILTGHLTNIEYRPTSNYGKNSGVIPKISAPSNTHYEENTSLMFWYRTKHITALSNTPQIETKFNFHYVIISHSYTILFYIIALKLNFKINYVLFNIIQWWWHN